MNNSQTTDLLIGIAKVNAAIISAIKEKEGLTFLSLVQSHIGAITNQTGQKQPSFQTLPAALTLKILSSPGQNKLTLEDEARQSIEKLLRPPN